MSKLAIILVFSAAPFIVTALLAWRRGGRLPRFLADARKRHDAAAREAVDTTSRLKAADERLVSQQTALKSKLDRGQTP